MHILVLVGPKGAGKTHVGLTIEKEVQNATFLSVEKIAIDFLASDPNYSADSFNDSSVRSVFYDQVHAEIKQLASALSDSDSGHNIIVIETTGAAPETNAFLEGLKNDIGPVHLVRIRSSASTCAERIQSRDKSKQVDVSLEMIERLHAATEALDWDWDLELENNDGLSNDEIVQSVTKLLSQNRTPLRMPMKVYQDDFSPAKGNALQAAVASIFGLSLHDVPNFIQSADGYEAAIEKFYRQGDENSKCVKIKLGVDDDAKKVPDGYVDQICILRGKSPRGDFGHVVVAKHVGDGIFEMLHDPHPEGSFLDQSEAYGWCMFFA